MMRHITTIFLTIVGFTSVAQARDIAHAYQAIRDAKAAVRIDSPACRRRLMPELRDARTSLRDRRFNRAVRILRDARRDSKAYCRRSVTRAVGVALLDMNDAKHGHPGHSGGTNYRPPARPPARCVSGPSCYRLAGDYNHGTHGYRRNYKLAYSYYATACNTYRHADACSGAGYLLARGWGIRKDLVVAGRLFADACRRGSAAGCNNLGYAYEHGQGVAYSLYNAKRYYRKACRLGDRNGCANRQKLRNPGPPPVRPVRPIRPSRPYAMSGGAFRALVQQVRRSGLDSGRVAVIRTAARHNYFTSRQVKRLLRLHSLDSNRLKALRVLAYRIVDKRNSYMILDAFALNSNRRRAQRILGGI